MSRSVPILTAFAAVKAEAERRGLTILESEIVGLVPEAALPAAAERSLQLVRFTTEQVLERRLRDSGL